MYGQSQGVVPAEDGAETDTAKPILDHEMVGELVEDYGADMLDELRMSLKSEGTQLVDALMVDAQESNAQDAAAHLHAIRGAGLSVGCATLGAFCQRLEVAAKGGVAPSADDVAELSSLLEQSVVALGEAVSAAR
ncbi:MAG: Hpt domain-containing protein [Pseudomonadota bacterium]